MKNLVIFGAPGSGKGTQSDILVEKYGFDHISTGDVLRAEIKADTELGRTAKGYIDNGQLIPDSLMIDILAATYDALPKKAGVIFDGFPRTIPQAEALKEMLTQRGTQVHAMLELNVPDEMLMERSSTAENQRSRRRQRRDHRQASRRLSQSNFSPHRVVRKRGPSQCR